MWHKSPRAQVSPLVYEVIASYAKKVEGNKQAAGIFSAMGFGNLIQEGEEVLRQRPDDLWARLNVAYAYQRQQDYPKALDHYLIANSQAPELADPLIGIGRICYDLALVDMTIRNAFHQAASGLVNFLPDERAKEMLLEARRFLLQAKDQQQLVKEERGTRRYISPPGTADQFLAMIESKL